MVSVIDVKLCVIDDRSHLKANHRGYESKENEPKHTLDLLLLLVELVSDEVAVFVVTQDSLDAYSPLVFDDLADADPLISLDEESGND
jgi:hypothetical protein